MDAGSGEWKESVQLVFEYFCERTPRSFVEQRGTSLVWNYKYAGEDSADFGGRRGVRSGGRCILVSIVLCLFHMFRGRGRVCNTQVAARSAH